DLGLGRVVILGSAPGDLRRARQDASTESERLAAHIPNREDHAVAESIVISFALLSLGDQADFLQCVEPDALILSKADQPVSRGRRKADAEFPQRFARQLA